MVVGFTYVHTWTGAACVAFVVNVVVGWKVRTTATTDFVLDALEQAIHARQPNPEDNFINHNDRGNQYLVMNYTQRLARAVGRRRSRPDASAVEMATLHWVDWFNNHRLFGPVGHISRAEAKANYYAASMNLDKVACLK